MIDTAHSTLMSVAEVTALINAGEPLFLAGSREALSKLPTGDWAGGTIPYFMADDGGRFSNDHIFCTRAPFEAVEISVADYGIDDIPSLYKDSPDNGITYLIVPGMTEVHKAFAEKAPTCDGFLFKPVVGWVAGVALDKLGSEKPAVFNGFTGAVLEDRAIALHVELPDGKAADLEIVNIFEKGDGDIIRFENGGFEASECLVNGSPRNLADYIAEKQVHTEFPLVGDYSGSLINVSFQSIDQAAKVVHFYAPVFPGVDYHFAKPVDNYSSAFADLLSKDTSHPAFACNCILNYLYGKLEGKKTGTITGPITFGEIAHQLLNQTMVKLNIIDLN